jgi:protein-disulfide isomerase
VLPSPAAFVPPDWDKDPFVQGVGGFLGGLCLGAVPCAWVGQQFLDAARVLPHGTPEARLGLALGEIAGGFFTAVSGLAGEVGGGALSLTGFGALDGVPVIVVSTAAVVGEVGNVLAGVRKSETEPPRKRAIPAAGGDSVAPMIDRRRRPSPSLRRALPLALLLAAGCTSSTAAPVQPTVEIPALAPAPAPIEAAVDPGPIPASDTDPTLGNVDALVTLVIFGDLEDPFYHRAIDEARGLAQRLGPEQLRVVYKHLPGPWHKHARAAELAAEAVFHAGGAAAFWSFHDAALGAPELGDDRYAQWATAAGVKAEAFHAALADAATARKIDADASLAETLKVVAAPWILVNGAECSTRTHCTFVTSGEASPLAQLIAAEAEKAVAALAAGVPRRKLYAQRSAANLADPPKMPAPRPAAVQDAGDKQYFGAKHLLVMYQGSRRATAGITRSKDEARARATEAMKKARKKGQRFEDLVSLYSDEPGAAARGGDLGKFPSGAMVPEFQAAVERTKVGEISEVVETPFGFHVILRTQ